MATTLDPKQTAALARHMAWVARKAQCSATVRTRFGPTLYARCSRKHLPGARYCKQHAVQP